MTIQIDDAGWGNPVGGVVIGAMRVETGEFHHDLIDVTFFHNPKFKAKGYLKKAAQISLELLDELNHNVDEKVEICTGYIHSETKEELRAKGIPFEEIEIKGSLQDKVEAAFDEHQRELGCQMRGFSQEKKWLREDYKNRKKYGKHGWKKWKNHFSDVEMSTLDQWIS